MIHFATTLFVAGCGVAAAALVTAPFRQTRPSPHEAASDGQHPLPKPISSGPSVSAPSAPPSSFVVEMKGKDFYWWFRFPGPDGEFDTEDDVDAGKELHIPTGHKVLLLLRSDDYVYVSTAPKLNMRHLAIPQRTERISLPTAEPGAYDIVADPLCSVRWFHDEIMGRILVQSPKRFRAWWKMITSQPKSAVHGHAL